MARFSGLEIEPCIVLEGRILSNAFASRDLFWSDHLPFKGVHAGPVKIERLWGLTFGNGGRAGVRTRSSLLRVRLPKRMACLAA